jgi:transcriptional regulator with XRE-family HTH domain
MPSPDRRRRSSRAPQYTAASYLAAVRALGTNLRRLRTERSWTLEEAATRCGMAYSVYAPIEYGKVNCTLTTMARLADGYSVPLHELLTPPPPRTRRK